MDAVTHPDPRVRQALESWIEQRVDVSHAADLARAFGISAVPVAVAVDGHGRIHGRQEGFVAPEAYADWLRSLSRTHAATREPPR